MYRSLSDEALEVCGLTDEGMMFMLIRDSNYRYSMYKGKSRDLVGIHNTIKHAQCLCICLTIACV